MDELDELTQLAAQELIKEGEAFVKKRDINVKEDDIPKERRVPNRTFLKNTLRDVMFVNKIRKHNSNLKISHKYNINESTYKKDTDKYNKRLHRDDKQNKSDVK